MPEARAGRSPTIEKEWLNGNPLLSFVLASPSTIRLTAVPPKPERGESQSKSLPKVREILFDPKRILS
jgi:hypothetical protein